MVTNICNPTYAATPQDKVWDWMLSCQHLLQHHKTNSLRLNFIWLANICSATPRTQKFKTTTLFVLPTSALCNTTRQKFETELCLSYQHLLCNPTRHKFETATLFVLPTSALQHRHKETSMRLNFAVFPTMKNTVQRRLSQPFNEMTKSLHSLYSICYDNSRVDPCRWLVKWEVWLDFLAAFQVKKTSAKSNTRCCHAWLHEAHYGITFLDLLVGWQHAPAYWKIEKYNSTWKSKTIEEDSRVLNFACFLKLIWNTLGFDLMQPMQVCVLVIRC